MLRDVRKKMKGVPERMVLGRQRQKTPAPAPVANDDDDYNDIMEEQLGFSY